MITAIVPAAGRSQRMGAHKQLLPFGPTTVLGHIVDQLLGSPVDEVCVVVGHQAERICAALAGRPVRIAVNPDYEHTDMLASVRCGLRALPAIDEAILVALGDQPAISAALVRRMIEAFRTAGKGIVVPVHAGQRGHPLLFAAAYRHEVLTAHDAVGLRGLLEAHEDNLCELPSGDRGVLCDIDDPDDYRRELRRRKD